MVTQMMQEQESWFEDEAIVTREEGGLGCGEEEVTTEEWLAVALPAISEALLHGRRRIDLFDADLVRVLSCTCVLLCLGHVALLSFCHSMSWCSAAYTWTNTHKCTRARARARVCVREQMAGPSEGLLQALNLLRFIILLKHSTVITPALTSSLVKTVQHVQLVENIQCNTLHFWQCKTLHVCPALTPPSAAKNCAG